MLSKEKAKFKSAFDKTKSQIHKDSAANKKLPQILGTLINFIMNSRTFLMFADNETSREFIADFKNS